MITWGKMVMCVHVLTRGTLVFMSFVELWLIIPKFLLYFLCKFVLKDVLEHSIFTNEGNSLLRNSCFLRRVLTRPSPSQAPTLVWTSHTNYPGLHLRIYTWDSLSERHRFSHLRSTDSFSRVFLSSFDVPSCAGSSFAPESCLFSLLLY